MTNFEKWKDEILKLVNISGDMIAVHNGVPINCNIIDCSICDFHNKDGGCEDGEFIKWLYEEYKEPSPKLTKREWYFLTLVGTGYIARDKDEALEWYYKKPYKTVIGESLCWDSPYTYDDFRYLKFDEMFQFIKWEDEEPWKVEDLLKLEVEE